MEKTRFILSPKDMINSLRQATKTGASKFITAVMITGTALLILLKPGVSKANEEVQDEILQLLNKYPDKEYTIQESQNNSNTYRFDESFNSMDGGDDALSYASANVSKYYPDMQDHLNALLSNFWNDDQKNAVDSLLNEHIMKNITDPKQRTAAIIYAIERYAYVGSPTITRKFSQAHVKDIDKNNAQFIFKGFGYGYIDRFNGYYPKLEKRLSNLRKEIEQDKKEIEQDKKEIQELNKKEKELDRQIEGIISQFTVTDVLTKPDIKKLVLETEACYIKYKQSVSPHLAELAKAAKQ